MLYCSHYSKNSCENSILYKLIYLCVCVLDYDCNEPLLDKAVLKATSSLSERGPENARLDGKQMYTCVCVCCLQCRTC